MKFGSGQSVKRVEDHRLLTGHGRYTDDLQREGMLFGATLRSPYGHADIRSIDVEAARAMPGVVAVYTHEDTADYGPIPCLVPLSGKLQTPRILLAKDRVRFVGDAVAFVVAESREAARAGAEAIEVDYAELPVVASLDAAIADGAPVIWSESAKGNILFDWQVGDGDAAKAALAGSAHVTTLRIVQNRVAPTSMEVRAALGEYDAEKGFTLSTGSQGVAGIRAMMAGLILKVPADQLRVVTGDVGGGFGMKSVHLCRICARPPRRPRARPPGQMDRRPRRRLPDRYPWPRDGQRGQPRLSTSHRPHHRPRRSKPGPTLARIRRSSAPPFRPWRAARSWAGCTASPPSTTSSTASPPTPHPVDAYRGAGTP